MGYTEGDCFPREPKHVLDEKWTLLFGLPVIAVLLALAVRRARAVSQRIREVREEMARNPQDPYLALAQLMAETNERRANKRGRGRG